VKSKGSVYLVGAGPGDAGLLTLRGAELLARADVVVYDHLVNAELLRLTSPTAEIIRRGKRTDMPQEEITALLIAKAREGKCVVRLKGGDPYIFGRGGEEAEEIAAAKVHFEVVPGVSSVVAAANYAGIPLTHRDHCSSFTVFTGHAEAAETKTDLRYEQIAKIPGTKVVLMGTERLGEWTQSLIAHGLAANTPVAMVQWGTTAWQQSVAGTLGTIAALVAEKKITPPALAIVGDVVKLRGKLNWFESRPLFGQRIVVTRTRTQASQLSRQFAERGAEVLEIPTIKTVPPENLAPIADALLELNSYDWLVFTSPNGVTHFFEYFFKGFDDLRDIGGVRIAAVGPATAAKLKELHLRVDLMPDEFLAVKIAAAFAKYESVDNLKICLARAEVANPELPQALEALGAIVDDIACYKTIPETEDLTGAAARMLEAGADWLTFASSSAVENFHTRFDLPALIKKFPEMKLASIGPETSKTLLALGVKPTVEAKPHTIEGLVAAVEKA
jgi:uroporphyrinogen III methyltransferase/synthase